VKAELPTRQRRAPTTQTFKKKQLGPPSKGGSYSWVAIVHQEGGANEKGGGLPAPVGGKLRPYRYLDPGGL
jgi:hypothetical protein